MPELVGVVESLDDVPEALREFYTEDDGRYRLNASDLVGKDRLDEFRSTNIKLQKALKRFEGVDPERYQRLSEIDPDKYDELLEAEQKRLTDKAEEKGEWEKLRTQLQENHTKELDGRDKTIRQLEGQLEEQLVTNAARKALEKHDAYVDLLLPHVRSHVRTIQDGQGRRKAVVVDDDGDRRVNGSGEDMTIEELVVEMRDSEVFSAGFKPSGKGGGGASADGGGATGKVRSKKDLTDRSAKLAFIKEFGDEAYLALPET